VREGKLQEGENKNKELSVVIPVFDEEKSLDSLYIQLKSALESLGKSYEIIFVDDGSKDNSWSVLERLHGSDEDIKGIQFRQNFGKAAALSAGFKYAKGEVIITMDADLQDDPGEISNFIKKLEEGYDLVSGWRFKRQDRFSKTLPSKFFNYLTSLLTRIELHDFNCGFKAYRKEVVKDIELYGELHRYIPVLGHWKGYKIGEIKVRHHLRTHGKSKYGLERFFRGVLDLITVMFLTRYIRRPLHLFGSIGLLLFSLGLIVNIYLAVLWFLGQGIGTRPLLLLGVLLMLIGFQVVSTGLIGEILVGTRGRADEGYSIKRILQ
jgi:glycosyltransferase involved in cell wall biosynthesis